MSRLRSILQIGPFLGLILLLVVVPLVLLTIYSFREASFLGVGSGFTLDNYREVFEREATVRIMVRTIVLSLSVATAVTVLAFVLAYALTFRLRSRPALVVLGIVVAAGFTSFLVRVFAWGSVLGTNGLVNGGLEALGISDEPLGFLYFSRFAVGVTMTYLFLPVAVLVVYNAMQRIDPRAVEASRDLGAGRWRTLFSVVVPQARFGLSGAFALTAVLAAGDFVTPRLVGGPRGQTVGATVQDLALGAGNLPGAAALGLSFVALSLLSLLAFLLVWRLTRGPRIALANTAGRAAGSLGRRVPHPIQRSLSVPAAICLVVYLVVPTILVIVFSFSAGSTTGVPIPGLTTSWYGDVVNRPGFAEGLRGSMFVALVAVALATAVAVPVAFALSRLDGVRQRLLWGAVALPFVVPPVLLGSSLLVAATDLDVPLGLGFTALAHSVLLISEIVVIVYARLQGIDAHLTEAARDLGASATKSLRTITFPILAPAMAGAALLAIAVSLDEVFVTSFTVGTDNTLPVWLLGEARQGFTPAVNAVGVMLLVGTLSGFGIATLLARRSVLGTSHD